MNAPQIIVLILLGLRFIWDIYWDQEVHSRLLALHHTLTFIRLAIAIGLLQWGGFFTA